MTAALFHEGYGLGLGVVDPTAFVLMPKRRLVVPTLDQGLLLAALQQEPFEPLVLVDNKWLLLKVAFIIAVTSAKRVGELRALLTYESCCRFLPDETRVILRPKPKCSPTFA